MKKTSSSNEKKSSTYRNKMIAGIIISAIIATIVIVGNKLESMELNNPTTIDSIGCDSMEQSIFHIHAHIDVFVNGQPIIVPALIGIEDNTCLYWLHTHKTDGMIHIEAPATRDFTLGEFLDIWKSTNAGLPPTNEDPIIYVNGQVVATNLKNTILHAHD